jgi:hypothetical protein
MTMIVRLSDVKREKIIEWINKILSERMIKNELRSLLNFLSFAARVVVSRRVFLKRLFNSLFQSWKNKRRVDVEMKTDLLWWKYFLSRWNEIKFLKNVETRREFALWTNAFDNYNMRDYFVLLFKSSMLSANNMQEMMLETLSRVTLRKTFLLNSKKTFLHNSRKTFLHNSRKISLNQSRNSSHAMRKILLDQSRNNSRSTRKLSLDQSRNNSHSMRKLSLDQAMRKLILDQVMRKLFLD